MDVGFVAASSGAHRACVDVYLDVACNVAGGVATAINASIYHAAVQINGSRACGAFGSGGGYEGAFIEGGDGDTVARGHAGFVAAAENVVHAAVVAHHQMGRSALACITARVGVVNGAARQIDVGFVAVWWGQSRQFAGIGVIAVTAAKHIAQLAVGDNHLRSAGHIPADVATAIDAHIAVVASFHKDQGVVGHTVHSAAAIHRVFHHSRGVGGSPSHYVLVGQHHITSYVGIGGSSKGEVLLANHGTLVAATIHRAHLTVQQDDVGHQVQVALVVTTKNSFYIFMVIIRIRRLCNIEEYFDEAVHGNTVATAIHRADMSAAFAIVDVDVDKGVVLNGLVVGIAILHVASAVVHIVAVSAAKHRIDGGGAGEADIGVYISQRGNAIRS